MRNLQFGPNLTLWRYARGMTQAQLADRAGIARPNLSAIERGRREVTLRTIRALAASLDIQPGMLVDGVPPQARTPAKLTRGALERIAAAAVGTKVRLGESERELAQAMQVLTRSRLRAARGRFGLPRHDKRAIERAWLVASTYPETVVQTLTQRIADRQAKP